jgi:hypothetical protein
MTEAEALQISDPPCRIVAEIQEVVTSEGKVWRFVSRSECVADHAWQQRERLLQLSDGATAVEISWQDEGEAPVSITYSPQLPPGPTPA